VTSPQGHGPELLEGGGREGPTDRFALWAHLWTARHRRAVRFGSAALTLGLLAVLLVVVVRSVAGPPLPRLVAAQVQRPPDGVDTATWQARPDGRPGAPVIALSAQVVLADIPAGGAVLLGVTGPGIDAPPGRPVAPTAVDPGHPAATLTLTTGLRCPSVTFPLEPSAFGLQVRARDAAGRTSTGTLPAGPLAAPLARLVQRTCGSWLARQDLTVVAARVEPGPPVQPWVRLDLTIRNRGTHPGRLTGTLGDAGFDVRLADPATGGTATGPAGSAGSAGLDQLRLPAGSDTQVPLRLEARTCDAVTSNLAAAELQPGSVSTTDELQLAADMAPADPGDRTLLYGEAFGPTGVLIEPAAASAITSALTRLCAGMTPVVTLVDHITVVPARREVTLAVTVDLTPGRVRSVTVLPGPADEAQLFVPLWTARTGLVPDPSGQVALELTYRAPPGASCPYIGYAVPSFTVIAEVPVTGGVRTLTFTGEGIAQENPDAISLLCR
jgi:hypothetical protein